MKDDKLLKKIKASTREHYVRKKAFKALQKEVRELKKQLAKHEPPVEVAKDAKKGASGEKGSGKKVESKTTVVKAGSSPVDSPARQDKLTLISGIGSVLEKKLKAIGVSRFEQIANWTSKEIDDFSDQLSFKGRIEREEWVQQAKALVEAKSRKAKT